MIRSMTAFARTTTTDQQATLVWEIRSVNHRYLEVATRLPETFRDLEMVVRERCRQRLDRGKLDITLRYQPSEETAGFHLNEARVQQLAEATRRVGDMVLHAGAVSLTDILHFPGVLVVEEADFNLLKDAAGKLLDEALAQLVANREREGESLKQNIEQRLDGVLEQADRVQQALPAIIEQQRNRLRQRIEDVVASPDPQRLEQELVMLAQKMDVAEELDRLRTHVMEVRHQLEQGGAIGRRLDFLMQELNREANTLGSKSIDAETSHASVELKVLIEQMREQVQNIE